MNLNPYLQFGGKCAQAFEFYKERLGAKVLQLMTYRGSPGEGMVPPEWRDKVMHASLSVGGSTLMGSDGMPGQPYKGMQGCALALAVDSDADADRMFAALSEGGSVSMALGPTFFAPKYGMVTDQFGVAWIVIREALH
jgi:PhnB protein